VRVRVLCFLLWQQLARPIINIGGNFFLLDDAPWTWKGKKADVYENAFEHLTDENKYEPYHYGEPVDPTEYQNEYIGQVIGIY